MKKSFYLTVSAFLCIAVSTSTFSAEGLYRWVDKDGTVTYSDTPPPKNAKGTQQKKLGDNVTENDNDSTPFAVKSAMQRNPVTVYINDCGEPCDLARALLGKRGVPFSSRDPQVDPKAADALKEIAGQLSVPTIVLGANNVVGFNESGWSSALDAAGYPRTNPNLRKPAKAASAAASAAPTPPTSTTAPKGPAPFPDVVPVKTK